VFKWPRSIALEAAYYVIVALTGLIITIVPAALGGFKHQFNDNNNPPSETCWYHYYFDGRINNIFNWVNTYILSKINFINKNLRCGIMAG
jgi:hypothetical protein